MIYDCFTFNDELEILEIRLNTLNDVVDRFVLVESNKSFTARNKPLFYNENKSRFAKFNDKIIHIIFEDMPEEIDNPWAVENCQRNYIVKGLKDCAPNDIIIITDVDEIPKPEAILAYNGNKITSIEMDTYQFYYNIACIKPFPWTHPKICRFSHLTGEMKRWQYAYGVCNIKKYNTKSTPNKVRLSITNEVIWDGGWHFTNMGTAEDLRRKLEDYAHQELNLEKNKENETYEQWIKQGTGAFGEGKLLRVDTDSTLPAFISQNKDRFSELLFTGEDIPIGELPMKNKKAYQRGLIKQACKNQLFPLRWLKNQWIRFIVNS